MNQREIKEMQSMKSDIGYLKKGLDEIVPKIEKMHETFIKGEGKIGANRKDLDILFKDFYGNGKPGIKTLVENAQGGVKVIWALLTLFGVGNLILIIKSLLK